VPYTQPVAIAAVVGTSRQSGRQGAPRLPHAFRAGHRAASKRTRHLAPGTDLGCCAPCLAHRTSADPRLASDDNPINSCQVDPTQIFEQRFDRQEPHSRGCGPQGIDPRQAVLAILNAHAKPDMWQLAEPGEFTSKEVTHALHAAW